MERPESVDLDCVIFLFQGKSFWVFLCNRGLMEQFFGSNGATIGEKLMPAVAVPAVV